MAKFGMGNRGMEIEGHSLDAERESREKDKELRNGKKGFGSYAGELGFQPNS